jgi:hypothetical protein
VIGDQSDPSVLSAALDYLDGRVDLVIDDGSHLGRHQIASFKFLYPRISERGFYVCEDLHCAYWATNEGGHRAGGTFVEYTKALIDELHAWFLDDPQQSRFMPFASSTFGIHLYAGLVVIEKRPITRPFHTRIGQDQE